MMALCNWLTFSAIEDVFSHKNSTARSTYSLADVVQAIPQLSPADQQTAKTALISKISSLKGAQEREISASVSQASSHDAIDSVADKIAQELDGRSLVSSALGGLASVGTGAIASDLLPDIVDKIEKLRRDE